MKRCLWFGIIFLIHQFLGACDIDQTIRTPKPFEVATVIASASAYVLGGGAYTLKSPFLWYATGVCCCIGLCCGCIACMQKKKVKTVIETQPTKKSKRE